MGRSKFPGKPSKHCHRKRVNVLPPTGELNQESHGSSVTVSGASKENKQDDDLSENEGESTCQTHKARPLRRRLSRKLSTTIRKNGRQRNFISKIRGKAALKGNRSSRNGIGKGHVRKDATNFTGKFVLPTRSVHSSRVIKPNKRFIDLNETLSVKKKGLTKRPVKMSEEKNASDSDSKDKLAFSNGHRVILRQARLKLPNQIGTLGPFSSNLHNGPGTIICGVCGAVRYYRFVKQARKFNIYSCESCRKFISKQIKWQNVGNRNSNVLICIMGQGSCYVPPVEHSQHWKISKCAYRSRCPACWLKMCLKAYHLPLTLKQNLTQLLPKNMRGIDFSFSNSLPPILWQKNESTSSDLAEVAVKQRPVRFRPLQKAQPTAPTVTSDVKRQKLDLKGPRVKHVCRSASIVLGQPLAMFGSETGDKKGSSDSGELASDIKCLNSDNLKSSDASKSDSLSITDEDNSSTSSSYKNYSDKNVFTKKEVSSNSVSVPVNKTKSTTPPPVVKGILLDYSHDLNLEKRFKAGFSLITTENLSTSAMCFLCGSAGREKLMVCCLCCESYHTFCLDNSGAALNFSSDWMCMRCTPCQSCKSTDKNKIKCPKCLKMYHNECFSNKEDVNNPKMICKECTKCQDCGTATAYNLSSFPGNMPLCLNCLDKRKVGMHCPICQHSFEDSSSGSKMLECLKCKKWVHADCEKLTSEQYDILKLLPASSSFTCSHCLEDSNNYTWRRSVEREMYRNFNQVLRLLTKNKTARTVLKKVGVRGSLFRKCVLTNNLDIDNNNYNKDIDKIYSFEESERLQKVSGSSSVNTLLEIKSRLCEYNSVKKFNNDMHEALKLYESDQLGVIYKSIFQSVFPWFTQSHEAAENTPTIPFHHIRLGHPEALEKSPVLPREGLDHRRCELCQIIGDGLSNQEARLLYCGNNSWVHANCAYWSTNVYEQIDNHLQNVIETIDGSKNTRCGTCDKVGASIQCHLCRSSSYHFMCARKSNFSFSIVNKACFCPKHPPEKPEYVLKVDEDFELNRSIFVQKNVKQTFRSEPENISCLIGSLYIKSLGKIEPIVSDTIDAIIPTGFICSKVFWSTKEPWKLVTYIISTSIQNPNCTTLTVDKNITVNHSLERESVDKAMRELNDWRRVYEKKSEEVDSEDEEEKNGTELLSPELTDTILEDLPHDILDGISVQDIFPNFSYEDMLSLDNSNTDSFAESIRKPEDDDSNAEASDFKPREWIRTKSDTSIRSRVPPLSLTVSYKVDSSHPPVTKKRKISKETSNNMLLLQVDGAFDDDSSSECGSPIGTNAITPWGISEEPVTCEKCQCTYRTQASYKRHLDSCDVLCTSESDSENVPDHETSGRCDEELTVPVSEPVEVTIQVNEPAQPVLIQAFESYQSQVHTSVVNMVPEPTPAPPAPPPNQQVAVQPTLTIAEPSPISISVPLCVGQSITPQIVQPSIEFQQPQAQSIALQPMQQVLVQRQQPARRDPVVLQQIQPAPTPGFVPFVDAFGQPQTNQSVQYVQLAPQVQPQPQLLQIRSDGNVIGILPSIQPTTVIVQQPQQLVLDSSGTFGWAQQPHPQIYYGFETIVQNTVMQSQQFLPTPVPGVLTANSSYSTTTQVFQTSKLEPVLDVSSNSFVLVNSSGQLEIPQQFSQSQSAAVVTSQTPTLIYSSQPSTTQKPIAAAPQNCISLPTAPFVSDHNIPMNVVPPIPKPPTSHGRPMSRVLPMPTNAVRATKKIADATKLFPEIEKPAQIKMEDKFVFSKDLMKIIESPKGRSRKFEILDYKVIKSYPKIETHQVFKVEEKPFKEFEPVEKVPKFSTYEPLKEIEKVKMELFEKPIKSLNLLESEKYLKIDSIKSLSSLENQLKTFDSLQLQQKHKTDLLVVNKKLKLEMHNAQKHHCLPNLSNKNIPLENNLQKLEDSIQKHQLELASSKIKMENVCRRNGNATVMNKQQLDISALQKKPVEHKLQIKPHISKDIFTHNRHFPIQKPQPEKRLDMPKLEDIIKLEEPIQTKPEPLSIFSISPKREPLNQSVCKLVIPPLLPVKPQPKEEAALKLVEEKPNGILSSQIPSPPQPISKKVPESSGAPSIIYTMENKEEGFKCSSTSVSDCWAKVLEAVQTARAAYNMPPLPTDGKQIKSVQLTGLKSSHVKYLVEQLPGASKCVKYKPLFKFTPDPQDSSEICLHGYGAVRCQPHKNRNTDPYDMFSWLSSKHREPFMSADYQTVQSRRVNNFPMAMKFKNLKLTSKYSVGVYRSKIHGKGLFCLRDIEPGEMVIEYAGEVIRSILTDKREKFYNSKGIGCYMFRVDDNFVVDATMKGNAARFINHSCDPNCYSKVVEIMGHKHIIIFALRRILSGEELTYDYKFPFEEDKIPCTCGARKCRKFLN